MRVRSLKDLGKGAWTLSNESPKPKVAGNVSKRQPSPSAESWPHYLLWQGVTGKWPTAKKEFSGAVPGRKFRIDIAFPDERLAIEVDGWQWHGKHLGDFKRDRDRQNELTMQGWRILRFTAGEIYKDLDGCLIKIRRSLNVCRGV